MNALPHPTWHSTRILLRGSVLAAFILVMSPLTALAQGISGAGTIFRTDGTRGYFLVGSFNTQATCQERVFKLIEYLKDQAQLVGESLTYRLHGCGTEFQAGTVYNDLKKISGLKHYMLLHPNFRMLIVSPGGRDAEKNTCAELTGYFQNLLGENVVCVPPRA